MNKKLLVGFLNDVIIVDGVHNHLCDRVYLVSFLYELAYEYGILVSPRYYNLITRETIDEYYTSFFITPICQPFYPNLISIEVKDIRTINITLAKHIKALDKNIKEFKVITESELLEKFKNGDFKSYIDVEFEWLSLKIEDRSLQLLYNFYKEYSKIKNNKFRFDTIPRKARVTFLQELEKCDHIKIQNSHEKQLWKKLFKVVHISKKKFPKSHEFFNRMNHKINPPKQKLKNLLEKAWRENKEFEALEEYLRDQSLTIQHLISDFNDIEIRRRISGYKKVGIHEFGNKKVGLEEIEIVELTLLLLKQKILEMIKPTGKSYYFPEVFKRISVFYAINEAIYFEKDIEGKGVDIILEGNKSDYGYTEVGDIGSFIRTNVDHTNTGFHIEFLNNSTIDKKTDYLVIYRKANTTKVSNFTRVGDWCAELKPVGQNSSTNLLLWVLDFKNNKLIWIGESLNPFFRGHKIPDYIKLEHFKNIIETFIYRRKFTMFELCKALYGKSDPTKEVVTIEMIKKDLCGKK